MRVTEICGFPGGDLNFFAYYHTKIENRNIILERYLSYDITSKRRNSTGKINRCHYRYR